MKQTEQEFSNFLQTELLEDRSAVKAITRLCDYFLEVPYGGINENEANLIASTWENTLHNLLTQNEVNFKTSELDCVTYIEVVLAAFLAIKIDLAGAANLASRFKTYLQSLRYVEGRGVFLKRNHFMSLDWVPNNSWALTSIMPQVAKSDIKMAEALIDKGSWLYHYHLMRKFQNKLQLQDLYQQGEALGVDLRPKVANLAYITLVDCIRSWQNIVQQLPDFFIMLIVRPNWDLTASIGTHLNVSHLGFGIKSNNACNFYHASSDTKKVVKLAIEEYLDFCRGIKSIGGVHFLKLNLM